MHAFKLSYIFTHILYVRTHKHIHVHAYIQKYKTNQIYNAHKVTPKCESEARLKT